MKIVILLIMALNLLYSNTTNLTDKNTFEQEKYLYEKQSLISPPKFPTVVDVVFHVYEISSINEVHNSFKVEGFMDLKWKDERLAFDKNEAKLDKLIFLENNAKEKLHNIWWPDIKFVNKLNNRVIENDHLIIYPDGTVEYKEKFGVELIGEYDLRKFPFDKQNLQIEIESFAWSAKNLVFHTQNSEMSFSDNFYIPEWKINSIDSKLRKIKEVRDIDEFSELIVNLEVERAYGYYLWKILLPLSAIVLIIMSVFLISPKDMSDRLEISFIGLLTVVAYQFVITDKLPSIPYFTMTDAMLTCSFLTMFLTIIQSVYIRSVANQSIDRAKILDIVSIKWYPLIYIVSMILIFIYYYFEIDYMLFPNDVILNHTHSVQ